MNIFEQFKDFALNNYIVVLLFIIFLLIINFSNLLNALKDIKTFFGKKGNIKNVHNFIFDGEIVTYENLLLSQKFDIVKINATTHILGVFSEYKWLDKYYKDYKFLSQGLNIIEVEKGNENEFDVIKIKLKKGYEKDIYFDISGSFVECNTFGEKRNDFIFNKIKDIYKKK